MVTHLIINNHERAVYVFFLQYLLSFSFFFLSIGFLSSGFFFLRMTFISILWTGQDKIF